MGFALALAGDGGPWGTKRRSWLQSLVAGAKVSEVAARHGVNANMLSTWRGQVLAGRHDDEKRAESCADFLGCHLCTPVKLVAGGPQPDARADIRPATGTIEIVLGDASIRVAKRS